jgi:hypothetical protein
VQVPQLLLQLHPGLLSLRKQLSLLPSGQGVMCKTRILDLRTDDKNSDTWSQSYHSSRQERFHFGEKYFYYKNAPCY